MYVEGVSISDCSLTALYNLMIYHVLLIQNHEVRPEIGQNFENFGSEKFLESDVISKNRLNRVTFYAIMFS